jgi:hypothetical protein
MVSREVIEMAQQILEGTWEEIVKHAPALTGQQVRLTTVTTLRSDPRPEMDGDTRLIIGLLRKYYTFHENASTVDFLMKHPPVATKLLDARKYIEAIWGEGAVATLDISFDPDNSQYDKMYVYVQTPEPATEALSSLQKFDDVWWNNNTSHVSDILNFDVECI